MKKITSLILAIALLSSVLVVSGCARRPSEVKTSKIMERYFKKYSKKYPDSIIGQYPVQNIRILQIDEIHRNFVAAYSILELQGGMALQSRFTILRKAPFGWRANSWENMGMANMAPQQ